MRLLVLSLATVLLLPASIVLGTETASADTQGRIATAFIGLGMAETMARCYGTKVSESLDQEEAQRAAAIVESASDGEGVRDGVSQSTGNIIMAFSYARDKCGY